MSEDYHFESGKDISNEDFIKIRDIKEIINRILTNSNLDQGFCLTVLFETIEQGIGHIYSDKSKEEQLDAMKKIFSDWIDTKIKLYKEEPKSHMHTYHMECTLCDNTSGSLGIMVYPPKVAKVKTEGCPFCYKGVGDIMTAVTLYDKDDNILLHHGMKELKDLTIDEAREKFKNL